MKLKLEILMNNTAFDDAKREPQIAWLLGQVAGAIHKTGANIGAHEALMDSNQNKVGYWAIVDENEA